MHTPTCPEPFVCAVCDEPYHPIYPLRVMARWRDNWYCTDCLENRPGKDEAEAEARGERQPMTQAAYRASGAGCCPRCQSDSIEYKSFDVADGICSQPCVCDDCDLEWSDYYRLAGYVRAYGPTCEQTDWDAFLDTRIATPDRA